MKPRQQKSEPSEAKDPKTTTPTPTTATLPGIIRTTGKGTGFVEIEGYEEDIIIESQNLNHALNGDDVEISLLPKVEGERQMGEVITIVKRAKTDFVGTVKEGAGFYFIVPDDRKMYTDIYIPGSKGQGVKEGQKVLVHIVAWEDNKRTPEGEVIKILGEKVSMK